MLDPVDVEMAHSDTPSCHHCLTLHFRSHGCHYASLGKEEDPMDGRLILRHQSCATEAVQILY